MSTAARGSLMCVKQHSSSQSLTQVCVRCPNSSQSTHNSPMRLVLAPLYSRMKGTRNPMLTRIRATVRMRNVNPRHRLIRETPSISIPTTAAAREKNPVTMASGATRLVPKSRDIHAIVEEKRTIEQMR